MCRYARTRGQRKVNGGVFGYARVSVASEADVNTLELRLFLNPNPPKGPGHREEATDERIRIEEARPRPSPIWLGTGCDSHTEGILADRGTGDGRDQRADAAGDTREPTSPRSVRQLGGLADG